jgi:hypothetical protein
MGKYTIISSSYLVYLYLLQTKLKFLGYRRWHLTPLFCSVLFCVVPLFFFTIEWHPNIFPWTSVIFLPLQFSVVVPQSPIMNRWLAHDCLQRKQYWRHIWSPTKCIWHVIIFTWTSQINKIKLKINLIQYQNQDLSNFQALLSKICQVQQECHIANHIGINFLLNICRRC